jgi:hypothetical protein
MNDKAMAEFLSCNGYRICVMKQERTRLVCLGVQPTSTIMPDFGKAGSLLGGRGLYRGLV